MKTVFFDIDTQIDFLYPAGALYVPGAERIVDGIARLNHCEPIVVSTMCAHEENDAEFSQWPPHCIAGTTGQLKPQSTLRAKRMVVPNTLADIAIEGAEQILLEKQQLNLFTNPNLPRLLELLAADEYVVYGVVTEYCVQFAAMGLLQTGKPVTLVSDAIQSLNQEASAAMFQAFAAGGGNAGYNFAIVWKPMILAFLLLATAAAAAPQGAVIACGGGVLGPDVMTRFITLAGGPDAPIVFIPTANGENPQPANLAEANILRKSGAKNITILHTIDRKVADSKAFVEPLQKARGVWFGGGRQWHLVDSYLNTRTLRELQAVLRRGGVIGGSSAGATILGSYLVRGARSGNTIMMAPGYEQGFAFVRNVAIDQHLLTRKRENDLVAVIAAHPKLLGIGIDEGTAVVIQGDAFEVVGKSKVAIYEPRKPYYFLKAGDRFNLKSRSRVP